MLDAPADLLTNTTSYVTSRQQKTSTHLLTRCARKMQTHLTLQIELRVCLTRTYSTCTCTSSRWQNCGRTTFANDVKGSNNQEIGSTGMLSFSQKNITVGRSNARSGSGSHRKSIPTSLYLHLSACKYSCIPSSLHRGSVSLLISALCFWALFLQPHFTLSAVFLLIHLLYACH